MTRILVLILFFFSLVSGEELQLLTRSYSVHSVDFPCTGEPEMVRDTGQVPFFSGEGIYLLRSTFSYARNSKDSSRTALYLRPIPFPVVVHLNGHEIYRWGNLNSSSCLANFSAQSCDINELKEGENTLDIYYYTDGQRIALPPISIGDAETVQREVFRQSFLNHQFVQAIAVMALFAFLLFFAYAASSGFHEKDILYFAFLTFTVFLGYTPFIFNHPFSDEVLWFKVSRIGYVFAVYYIYLFCSASTKLLSSRPWKLFFSVILLPFLYFLLQSKTKMDVNQWFSIIALIYCLPLMILNGILLIISFYLHKEKLVGVVFIGYFTFLLASFYDIYFVTIMKEPYAWTAPYGYFVLICAIIYAIYLRQSSRYHDLLKYKAELLYSNESLQSAHSRLVSEVEAKEQFIRAVAHEFRTPLNGMIGTVESLIYDGKKYLPADLHKNAVLLGSSFHRFELTVQNLIDYQDLKDEQLKLDLRPFSPYDLLFRLTEYCRDDAYLKNISLINLVSESALPKLLVGDYVRISVILNNIIRNAVKFTEVGGISLKAEYIDGYLCIFVSDTGCGIEPAIRSLIFEAFERGEELTFTQRYEGVGLGLAIVDALVRKMSGVLSFDSEPGKGTHFYVKIPLEVPDSVDRELSSCQILAAEDNLINRTLIIHQLQKIGCTVVTAENGREAVELAGKNEFDAVLMDVQMPIMDGLEAAVLIRDSHPNLPIIGVTANADKSACLSAGMNDVIFKPTTPEQLKIAIERNLGKKLHLK